MSLNVANTKITFATLTSRTHQRKCMKQKRIVCFRKHDDREIKTAEIYTQSYSVILRSTKLIVNHASGAELAWNS